MNLNFEKYLLDVTGAAACEEVATIQSLWSGYGKISRYRLVETSIETVVVKHIAPNQSNEHPRGWGTNTGHLRKTKSYEVETAWYKHWSELCTADCKVPDFIGAFADGGEQWIVLEDLDMDYPRRKQNLRPVEVKVCLKWLANFHATFLGKKPEKLWEVGTYWHLDTRPDEWERIEHHKLKASARRIDKMLNNCTYQTIVHGDAKVANFCFSENLDKVAAVDFQYVGGGCGMKDVAYLLGSCMTGQECEELEEGLLNFYFDELKEALPLKVNAKEIEQEWRMLYPYAVADFTRFLLGWMPTHQKVNDYSVRITNSVLEHFK